LDDTGIYARVFIYYLMAQNDPTPILRPERLVTIMDPAVLGLVKALCLDQDTEDDMLSYLASLPTTEPMKEVIAFYKSLPDESEDPTAW